MATWKINDDEHLLLRKGELISAIKSLRNRTDLGLKEAKDIVDVAREHITRLPPLDDAEIAYLNQDDNFLAAIGHYKKRTGATLKESKSMVDDGRRRLASEKAAYSAPEETFEDKLRDYVYAKIESLRASYLFTSKVGRSQAQGRTFHQTVSFGCFEALCDLANKFNLDVGLSRHPEAKAKRPRFPKGKL